MNFVPVYFMFHVDLDIDLENPVTATGYAFTLINKQMSYTFFFCLGCLVVHVSLPVVFSFCFYRDRHAKFI